MRSHAAVLGALMLMVACVGCASKDKDAGGPSATHKDPWWMTKTPWKAAAINGKTVDGAAAPTFQMLGGGKAGGSAGVNRWSGAIDEDAFGRGAVQLGDAITTLMAGSPEAMAVESEFLGALKRAKTIDPAAAERGELRMLDEHGVEVLRFVKG